MNLAQAKAGLRKLGMTIRKRDGEYRVAFAHLMGAEQERSAYYTDDLLDAYDTAGAMANECAEARADAQEELRRDLDAWDAIVAGEY